MEALSSERTKFQRRSHSFVGKNRDGTFQQNQPIAARLSALGMLLSLQAIK